MNETKNNHKVDVTNGAKFWFFEQTKKTGKPLASLNRKQRGGTHKLLRGIERKHDVIQRINFKYVKRTLGALFGQ